MTGWVYNDIGDAHSYVRRVLKTLLTQFIQYLTWIAKNSGDFLCKPSKFGGQNKGDAGKSVLVHLRNDIKGALNIMHTAYLTTMSYHWSNENDPWVTSAR